MATDLAADDDTWYLDTEPKPKGRWLQRGLLTLTFFLVVGATAFAYYWPKRHLLETDPVWRPRLVSFCNLFGCEVRPYRDIANIRIVSHRMRAAGQPDNAIHVAMVLRNNAIMEQAYPNITIGFDDIRGNQFASKTFRPADYLPGNQDAQAMPREQNIHIAFVIPDVELPPGYRFTIH